MEKSRILRIWISLSVLLMLWPLLFYIYVKMANRDIDFKSILQQNPLLNVQFINALLVFFMGYLLFQFQKHYRLTNKCLPLFVAMLVDSSIIFLMMQQMYLFLGNLMLCVYLMQIYDQFNLKTVRKSFLCMYQTSYHKGLLVILLVSSALACLQWRMMF